MARRGLHPAQQAILAMAEQLEEARRRAGITPLSNPRTPAEVVAAARELRRDMAAQRARSEAALRRLSQRARGR